MTGQRSKFRKFHDFLVSRVPISKTIDRSGMKPSPAYSPFNSTLDIYLFLNRLCVFTNETAVKSYHQIFIVLMHLG